MSVQTQALQTPEPRRHQLTRAAATRLPEMQVFEGEVGFDDSSGLHSGSQDILLCGLVVCSTNPF